MICISGYTAFIRHPASIPSRRDITRSIGTTCGAISRALQGLYPILRLPHDREIGLKVEECAQALAYHRVIVHEEDAHLPIV
jgi:hypothetical protein